MELTAGPELRFRRATPADLPELVRMLADDALGASREHYALPLPPAYERAFQAITADPAQELIVVELSGAVVGMLQLTFIPYLTHQGSWRALIEGVRIDSRHRASRLGRQMMEWAIDRARERHCRMVQLTTDKARPDAKRFYESLGFKASHEGMKLSLTE